MMGSSACQRAKDDALHLAAVWAFIAVQGAMTCLALALTTPVPGDVRALHPLLFAAALCVASVSHVRAFSTDPGGARADAQSDAMHSPMGGVPRRCAPCGAPKPERVHHCRHCNACVARYDHHCPWIANCVGLRNVRYYLQLLLWGTTCCLYSGILLLRFMLRVGDARAQRGYRPNVLVELFAFLVAALGSVAAFAVTAVLTRLLVHQCSLVAADRTTLEDIMYRSGAPVRFYDRGSKWKNACAVLGPPTMWLLPLSEHNA